MFVGLLLVGAGIVIAALVWYAMRKQTPSEFRQDGDETLLEEPGPAEAEAPLSETPGVSEPRTITDEKEEAEAQPESPVPAAPDPAPEAEEETGTARSSSLSITNRLMSSGYAPSSGRKIDTVILHSSYNSLGGDKYSVSKIVDIYESYGVSAHYIIDRQGKIYRLVEEKNVSYHAGVSRVPDGRTNVNDFSIGIEIVNDDKGDEYTDAQYKAVRALVDDLKQRYSVKYVLGHDDIAPGRKSDPWNFDWDKLR